MIASPTIAGASQKTAAGALAQRAAFEDKRVYKKVCLEKSSDAETLGLTIVGTATGVFEVRDVRSGGLVDRFNKFQNNVSEKMINVGDKIVAINGIVRDLNAMKVELFAQKTVNLVLKHSVEGSGDVKAPAEQPTLLTSIPASQTATEAIKVPAPHVDPHTDVNAANWQRQTSIIVSNELEWNAPLNRTPVAPAVTLMDDNNILPLEEQCEEAEKASCQVCVRCAAY